jgi:hypothetical protein
MTKTQENKRLKQIRRIHKRMKRVSVKEKDLRDHVLSYTKDDVEEELVNLTQYKADTFLNLAEN